MKQQLGILGLLLAVCAATAMASPSFLDSYNLGNVAVWSSLCIITSIGMAFVIITGGIDLSIGSAGGLIGCMLPFLLVSKGVHPVLAVAMVLAVSLGIGWLHGMLITKVRLQPFIVTLCGLLVYRSLARSLSGDTTLGFGNSYNDLRWLATGKVPLFAGYQLPIPFFIMLGVALLAAVFLNLTVFGRHLKALGRNEQAARFSGINTDRMVIAAYMICSLLAGIGGILLALEINSLQPSSFNSSAELYAIAGAVLGGCSLRGGEGSILGVVIGATVIRVISNSINILGIPSQWEDGIIGTVILAGVVTDELVHRWAARRRLMSAGKDMPAVPAA